jgi:hypothetical protein
VQQEIVRFLIRHERGRSFTQDEILDGSDRVHNNGAHRKLLVELVTLGVLLRISERGGFRLQRLPRELPEMERHETWASC